VCVIALVAILLAILLIKLVLLFSVFEDEDFAVLIEGDFACL